MQPTSPNAQFWQWFRANGDRLRDMLHNGDSDARQAAVNELSDAVSEVAPEVTLELGQGGDGKPDQLVASADGKPERVDAVKDFVDSAPALPGWEVVAFRPRMEVGDDIQIAIQGERIGPDDLWFRVEEDTAGLDLTLYVRGLNRTNEKMRRLGASLLAEHAMGERNAVTLINSQRTEPLPANPAAAGLHPFKELVAVIDAARAKKYPPPGSLPVDSESDWVNLQGTISGSPAVMLLHVGLQPVAGHPSYDRKLTVSIPFNESDDNGLPASEEEYLAASDFGDRIAAALEAGQESLLAMTMMTQGRRDLIFYTSNAGAALKRLEPFRTGKQTHAVEGSVERDTFWGMYQSFCEAASEGEPEE